VSGYKYDRSREFIPGYKFGCGRWRSVALHVWSEPEICHGAGFKLGADAGVRVQLAKRIIIASRAQDDDKRLKERKRFGPILNLRFLLGWRLRHRAKTVTSLCTLLSVLAAALVVLSFV
jgi:hypothetical protein